MICLSAPRKESKNRILEVKAKQMSLQVFDFENTSNDFIKYNKIIAFLLPRKGGAYAY